jgi:hypothetical protein
MTQSVEQAARRPAADQDIGRELSDDIDRALDRRVAPPGTLRAQAEHEVKQGGARVWRALKHRPSIGVLVIGGLAIAAADAVGVGELAMGIGLGFAAWQVLRKGKTVEQALEEGERIEGV